MSPIVQQRADEHLRPLRTRNAAAEPELTRQERVIFRVYVGMAAMIAAFLSATSALWALGV
jgi:hypothetical protein